MKLMKYIFVLLFLVIFSVAAYSQADSLRLKGMTREEILQISQDELLDMSMEDLLYLSQKLGISIDELLNMKTSVASKTVLTPRETPGIVSIITGDEIKFSGARDLIDVLRLVPGFDFGYDVQGVVGIGLRGNWVHEGKLLLLVDGQQMNELSYYNFAFGNHIPVDQIKRIEIIRGPGSAIYGGNAELGVISIITKNGKDIQGAEISGTYGQMQKSAGRTNLNLNTGFSKKDWDFTAKGFVGKANRSDQPFTEYIGDNENIMDLSQGGSEIKTQHYNVGVSNNNLSFRLIYDDYKTRYNYLNDSLDGYDGIYNEFRSVLGEIKYDLRINDKLSLIPKINYKFSRPYYEKDYWRNFNNNRYSGTLLLNYLLSKKSTVVAGAEWLTDNGYCINDSGYFYSNNSRNLKINNFSAFAEGTVRLRKINVVAGFRTELNSEYGWAIAPRFGLTGVFNKFHFKSLFSGAFRSPAIGNIDISSEIKPEQSFISEIEFGYRINDYMFITANVFDIIINNSIIYYDNGGWDPGTDWGYTNATRAGSDGIELEFKGMYSKGFVTVNYSYYTQAYRPVYELYAVPGHENSALGLPGHKMGFLFNYRPVSYLAICPSFVILGKKYGYTNVDEEDNAVVEVFDPSCLLNLSLTYENVLHKGLNISLAAQDILNQIPPYIQPYNGQFAPYPGSSREILLKISFSTDLFRKK